MMKQVTTHKTIGFLMIMALVALSLQVSAAPPKTEIAGDWQAKADFDGRTMESILSITRDKEGNLSGKWISFWGFSELQEVKFEDNKLTFVQVNRFRQTESTSNFTGTVKEGKLSGTLSGERGDSTIQGVPVKSISPAVGKWEIVTKRGERESTSTLTIKADKEGKLTVEIQRQRGQGRQGQGQRGQGQQDQGQQGQGRQGQGEQGQGQRPQTEIKDVSFKDGKLTFTRIMTFGDRQRESKYNFTIKEDAISGMVTTERGETQAEGKRVKSPLVGKWEMTITSERGERKQLLTVMPDLSGLYGPTAVEEIDLDEENKVGFKVVFGFGERSFESEFKGQLDTEKLTLTGEMTGFGDSVMKVTGKKIVPAPKKKEP
jgi:hypothetical protein